MKTKIFATMLLLVVLFGVTSVSVWANETARANDTFGEYHVGPGDIFMVFVWQDERLNQKFTIPPDGVITFPLVGVVDTTGMTLVELQQTFKKRLERYIPDVVVAIMPLEIHSSKVFVVGKVKFSGAYPIDVRSDVLQAIAMAGGLTPFAKKDGILVLRRGENGKLQKFHVNYERIEKGENLEDDIILKPGDVVVVP